MISMYHTRTVEIRGKETVKPVSCWIAVSDSQLGLPWQLLHSYLFEEANEQIVYEAILQVSEYLNFEYHDNIHK